MIGAQIGAILAKGVEFGAVRSGHMLFYNTLLG
jgi:hypothetical protein